MTTSTMTATPKRAKRERNTYLGFALIVFAYAMLMGLLVQFVVLPHWFPSVHAGNGLLEVSDSNKHHKFALEQVEKIQAEGWQEWKLRPRGQAPAGIASILYILIAPEPWVMLPLNALLHAFAAVLLLRIIEMFVPYRRWRIWTVLPFVLFPTTILWVTQIFKDGFAIAGAMSVLLGLLTLARMDLSEKPWKTLLQVIFFVMLGNTLAWVVRPYLVQIFQGVTALSALTLTGYLLYQASKQKQWLNATLGIVVAWALLFAAEPLTARGIEEELPPPKEGDTTVVVKRQEWTFSPWIPDKVEEMMFTLGVVRRGFFTTTPDAVSNIDEDVEFHSAADLLSYLPRAWQIAFLSPFPGEWFSQGSTASTQIMRTISSVEMIIVYAALICFLMAAWRWRHRIELYIILIFSGSTLTIMGVSVPNIGTLYRMRYGYIMVLVTLGIAAAAMYVERKRQKVTDPS